MKSSLHRQNIDANVALSHLQAQAPSIESAEAEFDSHLIRDLTCAKQSGWS